MLTLETGSVTFFTIFNYISRCWGNLAPSNTKYSFARNLSFSYMWVNIIYPHVKFVYFNNVVFLLHLFSEHFSFYYLKSQVQRNRIKSPKALPLFHNIDRQTPMLLIRSVFHNRQNHTVNYCIVYVLVLPLRWY